MSIRNRLSNLNPKLTKLGLAIIAASVMTGCLGPRNTPKSRVAGMVVVLPGIEGKGPLNISIANGLRQGGVPYSIDIYDWGGPFGLMSWFDNLTDENRNELKARELSRKISQYRSRYPASPVHLVAHSGGAGIAIRAVELLPKRASVDTVILLAGAVSTEYDLRRALRNTKRGIWNYYSSADVWFLGVGTTLLGTMDREYGPAAGVVGFKVDAKVYCTEEAVAQVNAKLTQVPHSMEMASKGHFGDHFGWANSAWVGAYLSPIILNQPSPELEQKAPEPEKKEHELEKQEPEPENKERELEKKEPEPEKQEEGSLNPQSSSNSSDPTKADSVEAATAPNSADAEPKTSPPPNP